MTNAYTGDTVKLPKSDFDVRFDAKLAEQSAFIGIDLITVFAESIIISSNFTFH